MPYLARHKRTKRYIPSAINRDTAYDELSLVDIANSRMYPTIAGARGAIRSFAHIEGHRLKYEGIDMTKDDFEIVEANISAGEVVE